MGTDGAGSIRIPAAFTGVVGLKPSYGRVPAWPISVMGFLAHLGPLTRTVTDTALAMKVIGQPDKLVPVADFALGVVLNLAACLTDHVERDARQLLVVADEAELLEQMLVGGVVVAGGVADEAVCPCGGVVVAGGVVLEAG